jgi:hypothetical protein
MIFLVVILREAEDPLFAFVLALAIAVAFFFVVIPQRSGGICFSHLPLPLLLR